MQVCDRTKISSLATHRFVHLYILIIVQCTHLYKWPAYLGQMLTCKWMKDKLKLWWDSFLTFMDKTGKYLRFPWLSIQYRFDLVCAKSQCQGRILSWVCTPTSITSITTQAFRPFPWHEIWHAVLVQYQPKSHHEPNLIFTPPWVYAPQSKLQKSYSQSQIRTSRHVCSCSFTNRFQHFLNFSMIMKPVWPKCFN